VATQANSPSLVTVNPELSQRLGAKRSAIDPSGEFDLASARNQIARTNSAATASPTSAAAME
jgi:hypothetical protein